MSLLEVKGLRIAFGGNDVVKGIDFSIAAGEKLALVGESGSGKTVTALSLLRLAANAHCSGSARFEQEGGAVDLLAMPEQQLRGIRGRDKGREVFRRALNQPEPTLLVSHYVDADNPPLQLRWNQLRAKIRGQLVQIRSENLFVTVAANHPSRKVAGQNQHDIGPRRLR